MDNYRQTQLPLSNASDMHVCDNCDAEVKSEKTRFRQTLSAKTILRRFYTVGAVV